MQGCFESKRGGRHPASDSQSRRKIPRAREITAQRRQRQICTEFFGGAMVFGDVRAFDELLLEGVPMAAHAAYSSVELVH